MILVIGATTAFAASAAGDSTQPDGAPLGEIGMKFYDYKLLEGDMALGGEAAPLPEDCPVVITSREEESAPVPILISPEEMEWIDLDGENIAWGEFGRLLAVRPEDESRFTPEEWAGILEEIERGTIVWQDWD